MHDCRGGRRSREGADILYESSTGASSRRLSKGVISLLDSAELLRRLEAAGIANGRVNTIEEYLRHPQLTLRDCWTQVDTPAGPIEALFTRGIEPAMGSIPAVGEHTQAVLAELKFDREMIATWKKDGMIQ